MTRRANGEGSIYRRSDGRWVASMSLGRGRRKNFYGRTRHDVAAKLAEALRNHQLGVPPPTGNQTVAQYLRTWLDSARTSVRPRTYEAYDLCVRRLLPHLDRLRISALTPAAIERAYAALLEDGLSRRSVEQTHAVLHRALRQAVQWGLLGRNPTDAVNVPRPKKREMHTLGAQEVQRLFAITSSDRLHALWVLLVTTGLRLGEALGLTWDDIDFGTGRLSVRRALQRQRGEGLVFVEPKTSKSRRAVYLPEGTVTALREHRRHQLEERLQVGPAWRELNLVFSQCDGRPLEPSSVSQQFRRVLERGELPRIRVHDLRHTCATLLLAKGVHPKIVQELLGHSTIALTMDTYSHVTPALHAEVARQMSALFVSR